MSSDGRAMGAPADKHGSPIAGIAVVIIALASLVVIGVLPRMKRNTALAQGVRDAKAALPQVTIARPVWVSDPGLVLPGNIQAILETTINARTSGYLRKLYVDIGSRVRAGQVLGVVQAPDVDQQAHQAAAQTDQSRAVVWQSKADVVRQKASVAQNRAEVSRQQAAVEQASAQLASARAALSQAKAAEQQAEAQLAHTQQALDVQKAALTQAEAQRELARVTNDRYQGLYKQGYDSAQDADQSAAALKTNSAAVVSAHASVHAAEADVRSAQQAVEAGKDAVLSAQANVDANVKNVQANIASVRSEEATVTYAQASVAVSQATVQANQAAVASSQANQSRYNVMRGFENVVAPFTGVITSRNVDAGALIAGDAAGVSYASGTTSAPATGMLGIARTDVVRIQVDVPQAYVPALQRGSIGAVSISELPGKVFTGPVVLRAGALDLTSRTMLAEVHLANPGNVLVPGMFAEVAISAAHPPRTLHITGTALVIDANGNRVVVIEPDDTVRFVPITVGRDFGTEVEVLDGLRGDERLVNDPSDLLQDGERVQIVASPLAKSRRRPAAH